MGTNIKFDAHNYRKHSDKNKSLINKSLKECGAGRSIVIDNDGEIIAGNGIYEQAQKLNIPTKIIETDGTQLVVVKRTDLNTNDEKRKQLAIMDNSTSDSSEFDLDSLQADFDVEQLQDWGLDVEFESLEEQEIIEDEVPEEVETKCKLGDIWQLGSHRLMCGDSTSITDVEKLMDGTKADMVFTDPPYGMNLDTDYSSMKSEIFKGGIGGKKYEQGMVDDFKPEMISTILTTFDYVKEIFLWGADYFAELLPNKNDGSWVVWDKRANGDNDLEKDLSSDKMYGSCFELCWSKNKHKRDIARIKWAGIFGMYGEDKKRFHPTQKPQELVKWFLDRYSKEKQTIVDLFGGSGSTLIACEQLDRKCYMMELDPHYCDVILQRYIKFKNSDEDVFLLKDGNKIPYSEAHF